MRKKQKAVNLPKVVSAREVKSERVERVVKDIKKLENKYGVELVRLACGRYHLRMGEKVRLQREIEDKQRELDLLQKKRRGRPPKNQK